MEEFNSGDLTLIGIFKGAQYEELYSKVRDKIDKKYLPKGMVTLSLTFTDIGVLAVFADPPPERCIFSQRQIISKIIRWRQLEK